MATYHGVHNGFHGVNRFTVRYTPNAVGLTVDAEVSAKVARRLNNIACPSRRGSGCQCGEHIACQAWESGKWYVRVGNGEEHVGNYPQY